MPLLSRLQSKCWGGITVKTMLTHAVYFFIFLLGMVRGAVELAVEVLSIDVVEACLLWLTAQSFSVFAREISQRRQCERQRRAVLQKQQLEVEERRSMALLANMLPLSIVKQLTVRRLRLKC